MRAHTAPTVRKSTVQTRAFGCHVCEASSLALCFCGTGEHARMIAPAGGWQAGRKRPTRCSQPRQALGPSSSVAPESARWEIHFFSGKQGSLRF